jgi:predicted phosphate transport protein (TIGR00153 family)
MRFLPREEKFFDLFVQQAKLISQAATLLLQGAEAGNAHLEECAEKITELEKNADSVLHEVFQRLNQTFITPLDPEDIHSLSTHLDDVIDGMEELAHRMVAYNLEPIPRPVLEGCREIVNCARSLELAFQALHSDQALLDHCIEVNRVEEVVDQLMRKAVRDLFREERDPIRIMKLKEVYDLIEQTTDYCEDVAVALQNVVVKNS